MEYILPSHIFYYDAEKTKIMVIQYTNNKVYHNLFGPAWIKYNKYGNITDEFYFISGEQLTKEQWEIETRRILTLNEI